VSYHDLAADPVGTLEAAYTYFGLPFSGAAADAMRAYLGVNRSRSAHRYTLGDFGLTAAEVGARFGALGRSARDQANARSKGVWPGGAALSTLSGAITPRTVDKSGGETRRRG